MTSNEHNEVDDLPVLWKASVGGVQGLGQESRVRGG